MGDEERSGTRFAVGPGLAGYRLDQFLQRMIPKLSRHRIQQAIHSRVRLTWDAPVKPSTLVRDGGEVIIDNPILCEAPIDFDPVVLYESDDLLAIDKPPGVVVHPTHSHLENTVITLLRRRRNEPELTLAHRLDAETSGVLLLGRHRWAARKVQTAFERGRVQKTYLALVFGAPEQDDQVVDVPLGTVSRDTFVFRQSPDGEAARHATTRIVVLERLGTLSLVRAEPRTGRRHQIRAHLAGIGHPIVGDKLYRLDDRDYRRYLRLGQLDGAHLARLRAERLMLHARSLSIPHPRDPEQRIEICAPLPDDMQRHLDDERGAAPD